MSSYGRYKVVKKIAQGKTADVYLARREEAGGFSREFAIKTMTQRLAGTGDALRAFLRESRVHGLLSHPNIANIVDVDEERGHYYIVMEHVPGRNLRSIISSLSLRRRIVSLDVAMSIAHGVASALHHAHMLGIVHRDVSPSNVMIAQEGYVKLLDWGTAIEVESPRRSRPFRVLTATRYSAPEVIWNDSVDPRADVYSLGVILYELTTGKRLFDGKDPMKAIAAGDIPKPSSVRRGYPSSLEAVIQRAVSKKPEDRFQTAGDFKLALETLATEHKFTLSEFRVGGFLADIFNNNDAVEKPPPDNSGKTRVWLTRKRRRAG